MWRCGDYYTGRLHGGIIGVGFGIVVASAIYVALNGPIFAYLSQFTCK